MKKRKWFKVLIIVLALLLLFASYLFYQVSQMTALDSGKINDDLYAVKNGFVNFFILQEDDNIICFDAGVSKEDAEQGMNEIGIDPAHVTHVFLTHSDGDHAGGLLAFPNAKIYLSKKEMDVVNGKTPRIFFYMKGENELPTDNYLTIEEGEILHIGGIKVEAISTPGHTPGSTSYMVNERMLFVGDALQFSRRGEFIPIWKPINNDYELTKTSIEKIKNLKAEMVLSAHDGFWMSDDAQAF